MPKHAMLTRTTALAAAAGLAVLLGAGAASADGQPTPKTLGETSLAQADTKKADEKKADEKKAEKPKPKPKPKPRPSWASPVSASYTFTGTYNQGGARWAAKHSGQDFAAPTGTPVKSVHAGTVVEAGWGGAYGNNIVIRHSDGVYTQYGHLSKMDVRVGQAVDARAVIGAIGSTGNSTGPHLHFEVRSTPYYGSAVDPVAFLKKQGVGL